MNAPVSVCPSTSEMRVSVLGARDSSAYELYGAPRDQSEPVHFAVFLYILLFVFIYIIFISVYPVAICA